MACIPRTYNLPPGPFSLPIVGNARVMAADSRLVDLMEMEKQYGQVFRLNIGKQLAIMVSGEAIKEAFVTKAVDFAGRPSLHSSEIFGYGGKAYSVVLEDYSPTWKLLRKITIAAYEMYTNDVRKQAAVINEEFDRLLQIIQSRNGQPHDIANDLLLALINVFCVMMFGTRYDLDDPELTRLAEVESGIFHLLTSGFLVDVFSWLKSFPFKSIQTLK